MSSPASPPNRSGTVTLCVGWSVLAVVAGVQAMLGWSGKEAPAKMPVAAAVAVTPVAVAAASEKLPELIAPPETPPPVARLTPLPQALPVAPLPAATPIASLDAPIRDEAILTALEQGLFHKEKGDLLTAVGHFRKAWESLPDHPRLIYQLAQTYDLMGLEKRAAPLWKSLQALGKAAGDYAQLTERRLWGVAAETVALETEAVPEKPAGQIRITNIKTTPVATDRTGERQEVAFSLKRATLEEVVPEEIAIVVHFFETLNGRKIDRSQLPEEPQIYQLAAPLDWPQGEEEPLQVDYFQPRMSPAEILKFGHRTYYGQVIEVFWKGQLQDVQADPPELVALCKEIPISPTPGMPVGSSSASAAIPAHPAPVLDTPIGLDPSLFSPPGPAIGPPSAPASAPQ